MKILFKLLIISMMSLIYADCSEFDNQEDCENIEGCMWEDDACYRWDEDDDEEDDWRCEDIDNQTECEAVGCEWSESDNMPGDGYCSGEWEDDDEEDDWRCEDIDNQEECERVDGCEWSDNGGCYGDWEDDDDEDGDGGALDNDADLVYNLLQNYPNPFNPQTTINFSVVVPGQISLKVYDISGKEIGNLINGFYAIGNYSVQWNAKDMYGNQLSSGIYIYQLNTEKGILSNRMVLMR